MEHVREHCCLCAGQGRGEPETICCMSSPCVCLPLHPPHTLLFSLCRLSFSRFYLCRFDEVTSPEVSMTESHTRCVSRGLTKPVQPFSLRKRHVRTRPHTWTDSAHGMPKFTVTPQRPGSKKWCHPYHTLGKFLPAAAAWVNFSHLKRLHQSLWSRSLQQ